MNNITRKCQIARRNADENSAIERAIKTLEMQKLTREERERIQIEEKLVKRS